MTSSHEATNYFRFKQAKVEIMEEQIYPINNIRDLPPRTVEYFCKTYLNEQVRGLNIIQQYKLLESSAISSQILAAYNEAYHSVEKKKDEFDFYIRESGSTDVNPIDSEDIKTRLEQKELFGLAFYYLLLEFGSMEVHGFTYYATRKSNSREKK